MISVHQFYFMVTTRHVCLIWSSERRSGMFLTGTGVLYVPYRTSQSSVRNVKPGPSALTGTWLAPAGLSLTWRQHVLACGVAFYRPPGSWSCSFVLLPGDAEEKMFQPSETNSDSNRSLEASRLLQSDYSVSFRPEFRRLKVTRSLQVILCPIVHLSELQRQLRNI